jgi:hypothetical protein
MSKIVQQEWVRFTKLDGYQEPRYSDQRHHWVQVPNRFLSRGYAVICAHCCMVMGPRVDYFRCMGFLK